MIKYIDNIARGNRNEVMDIIKQSILDKKKKTLITANSEVLVNAIDNKTLQQLLTDEDTYIVVDGIAALKSFNFLGAKNITKIPGVEIVQEVLEFANSNSLKIAVLGGTLVSSNNFNNYIKENLPNVNVVSIVDGFSRNKDSIMQEFSLLNPDIVLVALGVPNQELLIAENYKKFAQGLFIGCGGSIDVIGQTKKRAPKIFRVTSTEWLYRIVLEPNRISRFFFTNWKFLKETIKSKK